MKIMLAEEIQFCDKSEQGYRITLSSGSVTCDQILLAAGRAPNLQGLGLQEIGVSFSDKGQPELDEDNLKIPDYPIYLAGDVNGREAILHEAQDEATIIASHILNKPDPGRRVPLKITFTDPVIAQIGEQPAAEDDDRVTGSVSYEDQGRATIMHENHGMLKIYASKKRHVITGATIIAPSGEHLAHLLALAVQQKLSAEEFLSFPFYHPTLEEGIRTALRKICNKCE